MLSVFGSMLALMSGVVVLGLASGLLFTLLGVRLASEGVSDQMIGLVGSAYFAGLLAGSVVCDRVIRRVGHIRALIVFASVSAVATLLHVLITPIWAWAALRAVMGFAQAGLFMVAESWLQFKSTNETRGRIFALYVIAHSGGIGAGPLLINLADPAGDGLFLYASILYSIALLPVALSTVGNPELGAPGRVGVRELFAISPVAVVGSFVIGSVIGSFSALGPVFGERVGMSALAISLLMTAMRLGGFVVQYPIGALSDRFDRRHVMIALGAGGAVAATGIAAAGGAVAGGAVAGVLALSFLFGALCQPIYGLAVSHANDYVEPQDFVAASAGLLFAYGVGATIGPAAAAAAMDAVGPWALFLFIAIVLLGFCIYVAYRMWRREPVPAADQGEFVMVPPNTPAAYAFDPRAEPEEAGEVGAAGEEADIERELDPIRWS